MINQKKQKELIDARSNKIKEEIKLVNYKKDENKKENEIYSLESGIKQLG